MLLFSTPHVSRSRDTCHVIQVFEIPLSCNVGLMMFTTKHVIYKAKVCFRGLLVCWHFPALTWVGQGPHIMWFSRCNMHAIEPPSDLVLWHSSAECTITQHVILLATLATLQSSVQCTSNSSYDTAHMSQSRTTSCEQPQSLMYKCGIV